MAGLGEIAGRLEELADGLQAGSAVRADALRELAAAAREVRERHHYEINRAQAVVHRCSLA